MKSGKFKLGLGSFGLAGLLLLLLFFLNLIFYRHFVRIDLTEDKLYTLSESSKKAMKNLDDIVNIKVYFSKKLPTNLLVLRQEVKDLLEEYKTYAHGNLKVEFIDPKDDPKIESQVLRLGIPTVQMNILEKDKFEVVKGYLGMAFFYEDRVEIIPVVESTENLEYEITSRILKVWRGKTETVGLLVSKERDSYEILRSELEKEYNVKTYYPGDEIPDTLKVLILTTLKELDSLDLFRIDQYIMKGGKVLFLVNAVEIDENLRANTIPVDKLEILENYGIKVNRDLVLDRYNEIAPFSQGMMRFFVPYPYWVKIQKRGFDPEHPVVQRLESIVLPWTSSLEITLDTASTVNAVVLAKSSPYSWIQKGFFNLNPQAIPKPSKEGVKERPLVVLLNGVFKSYYKDGKIPEGVSGENLLTESVETQLLVVGNSRFVEDLYTQFFPENLVFLLNVIDYMSLSEDLIAIRSKGITDRPLKELSERGKMFFKIFNTYGMAVLVVVFGLVRYAWRRRERKRGV
jgi:gliding-associated putative ABC transporter substrate-binding component GldG